MQKSPARPAVARLARAAPRARSGAYRAQRRLLSHGYPALPGIIKAWILPVICWGTGWAQIGPRGVPGARDHQDLLTLLENWLGSNRVPVLSVPWYSEVISRKGPGDSNRRSLRGRNGEFDSILPRDSTDYVFHDDVRGCQYAGSQGHAGPSD